ncbi:hypothetical protein Aperf_G00000109844 [Anoplocephala perfoliata]
MRPDIIYCGSCSLEFPLSDLTIFIEHKRYKCSNSLFDTDSEYLQCSQCIRSFHTPWPLLYHVQTDHGIKIVRNLRHATETPSRRTDSIGVQSFPFEQEEFSSEDQGNSLNRQRAPPTDVYFNEYLSTVNKPNNVTLVSANASVSLTSQQPRAAGCQCRKNQQQTDDHSLSFQSLPYKPGTCSPLNVALNLEESLRLIHRIACSKLDMHLRQMTSFNSPASSYALSFCCSCTNVSCLCAVDSCSCDSQPPLLKSSASCQTDDLSDPQILDLFSPSNLFSLSDKPSHNLNESPSYQDFSFLNCLTQGSESTPPIIDSSISPPTVNDSLPVEKSSLNTPSKVLPYACSFCGRFYRQKIHLRKHVMAQHTKEKPFYCPHCAYTTVEKSHLKVHIRTHTGERPYICRVCHYSSTQNCTLKSHYLRKHPESKITCSACERVYITELEYQNHLKNCPSLLGSFV